MNYKFYEYQIGRNPPAAGSGYSLQSFCEKQKGFPLLSLTLGNSSVIARNEAICKLKATFFVPALTLFIT